MALAMKLDGKDNKAYCIIGDGELAEGQIWEAAMAAAKFNLDNLCGIVDVNGKILLKKSCKTGAQRPAEEIMTDMAALVEDVICESGFGKEKIAFLGIAAPGIANSDSGVIEYSCN